MEIFPEKKRVKDSFIDYNVGFFSSGNGNGNRNHSFSAFLDDSYIDCKSGLCCSGKGIKAENSKLNESYSMFSGGLNDSCIDYNVGLFGSGDGSSVVDTELSKSFPRFSGGLDSSKGHKDMLIKSTCDDMSSGLREDYARKVCVKSESPQMNEKSKRKVLIKEDPDWSPWREDTVSERWSPERKRDRKSLVWKNGDVDVSRTPVIQALPAVRMFETYWNQGGNKKKAETRAKFLVHVSGRPVIQALPAVRMFETYWNQGGNKNKTETRENYLPARRVRGAMIKFRGDIDNSEDEDYSGVSDLPIIALPAPCSFKDFCMSAGWKVTLSEDGTTIYCSPTGGIYDSPSKVLEAISQKHSVSKNAESDSFQPVDNSKPFVSNTSWNRRNPMKISVTDPTDSDAPEEADGAVQLYKNLGEIEKSIQSRKKSLVDKFVRRMNSLNNEKSSSESGSGVTSTGDCESELQGTRRSTRIKGRHVAVDFEFDTERFVSEDGLSSSGFEELKNSSCKPEIYD